MSIPFTLSLKYGTICSVINTTYYVLAANNYFMINVFGHKSPDTDATGSALIWAWYINEHTTQDATAYVLGELNSETCFVLNHFGVSEPGMLPTLEAGSQVMIVDTNNPQELPENINEMEILQIIDHHKLVGGLETSGPIDVTMRPLACTATVIHDLMGAHAESLPKEIAGLMLSCILSDTLEFRSPTTTPHDKDVAEKLATTLGIEIKEYAAAMFAAKSDVSAFSDKGLVTMDSKKYDVGEKNFRVSVLETTTPQTILERKDGIIAAISELIKEENDVDEVLLFVVDILNEEATALTYNDLTKQVIESSFGVTVEGDTEVLPGIVSRKKQILPALKL
ncbi:MAG: manganese-dependent inorganic pyrophosphatase [Patiriisocius sp.]|jgi:manganese-dependent inorganic pyrophosphatase